MTSNFEKTNYFYVDEAGGLTNDSKVFILGCYKTDTPDDIKKHIEDLLRDIHEDLYFEYLQEKMEKDGFHAAKNHPDIICAMFRILPFLNFLSYFEILLKSGEYYKDLIKKYQPHQIYKLMMQKLILNRIKGCSGKCVFYFEELSLSVPQSTLLDDIFKEIDKTKVTYSIVTKKEKNLSLIDYLNYIFIKLSNSSKSEKKDRFEENFELVRPKIALIHYLNEDVFLNRNKGIELENVIKLLAAGS